MSEVPSISVVTPTLGRKSLSRTAESVRPQLLSNDEWWIVGDGPQAVVRRQVEAWANPQIRYLDHSDPNSRYGNAQRNVAMRRSHGDLFLFLDDDDALAAGALDAVRRHGVRRRPMMFRMDYRPGRRVLWDRPVLSVGNVAGAAFVVPRLEGRWCEWTAPNDPVTCDVDYIRRTLDLWPADSLLWCEEILCVCYAHGEGR